MKDLTWILVKCKVSFQELLVVRLVGFAAKEIMLNHLLPTSSIITKQLLKMWRMNWNNHLRLLNNK